MPSTLQEYMMRALSCNSSGVVEFWRLLEFQGLDIPLEWCIKTLLEGIGYISLGLLIFYWMTGELTSLNVCRYGFLLSGASVSQDPLSISVSVLQQFNIPPEMYQVGFTKLYLRTGQVCPIIFVWGWNIKTCSYSTIEDFFHAFASQKYP